MSREKQTLYQFLGYLSVVISNNEVIGWLRMISDALVVFRCAYRIFLERTTAIMNVSSALSSILVLLCFSGSVIISSDKFVKDVEVLLDDWKDRATARQRFFQLGPEAQAALQSVAIANNEALLRRIRAISLLGALGNAESIKTLEAISETDPPFYRCFAMQAMAEIGTEETLPVFIRKLEDKTVCMKQGSSDPAERKDIPVCDEAIRLLEHITGLSLAAGKDRDEKIDTWKAWWKNRINGTLYNSERFLDAL